LFPTEKKEWAEIPATGETMTIPAKKVLKFRIAKAAKDAVLPSKK
jgi:DNA-binding protein HU-beta